MKAIEYWKYVNPLASAHGLNHQTVHAWKRKGQLETAKVHLSPQKVITVYAIPNPLPKTKGAGWPLGKKRKPLLVTEVHEGQVKEETI
jgi:hypothetical protein